MPNLAEFDVSEQWDEETPRIFVETLTNEGKSYGIKDQASLLKIQDHDDTTMLRIESEAWCEIHDHVDQLIPPDVMSAEDYASLNVRCERAKTAVNSCAACACSKHEPMVEDARIHLRELLESLGSKADPVHALFLVRFSTRWLEYLYQEIEAIERIKSR